MTKNYQTLIQKLNDFIRYYYRIRLFRGLILFTIYFAFTWLFVSLIEYFGQYSISVRTIIFNLLLVMFIVLFSGYVLIPLLKFFRIGKVISHEKAANLISHHFTEIQDKLLNTLELYRLEKNSPYSKDLLFASIDQRTQHLSVFSFNEAIALKQAFRYLLFMVLSVFIVSVLFIAKPVLFQQGTKPILQHNMFFEKQAPFSFHLLNDSLAAFMGDDIDINVRLDGEYVPENVMITYAGNQFLMKPKKDNVFHYQFKSINNPLSFNFIADEFESQPYHIRILPAPLISNFTIICTPPTYTGIKEEILQNIGNLNVPVGSKVTWKIITENIDSVNFILDNSTYCNAQKQKKDFTFFKQFFKSTNYTLGYQNKYVKKNRVFNYQVRVIPDLYPEVKVKQYVDSINPTVFYFAGNIKDDYGLTKLTFIYSIGKDSIVSIPVEINKNSLAQGFEYGFDFSGILTSSQTIKYYFEIWDNDEINGHKSSRSSFFEFNKWSKHELDSLENAVSESVEKKLKESQKLTENIKKNLDKLKKDKIAKNLTSWEKTKILQSIKQQQQQLQQTMQNLAKENQQKNNSMKAFSEQSQQLMEKQKQIEDLLNNLMDDELKKMLEEIEKLMDKAEDNKTDQQMDKMSMDYNQLEKQLNKNLEILKRFEVEKKIEQTVDKLQELSKKQEELSEKSKDKNNLTDELTQKQKEQKEAFEKAMEDYKNAMEKNKDLEQPYQLDSFMTEQENVANEFDKGSENLSENKRSKASQSQQKNSQNMENMAQKMQQMMSNQMMQQQTEDMNNLKQIIDNLTTFSFQQEDLLEQVKKTTSRDPKLAGMLEKQRKLSESFEIIEDSLYALSKRVPMIDEAINKEINHILMWQEKSFNQLSNAQIQPAVSTQQFIMTAANNLNLLLSELVQQMKNQMMQKKSGNQMCQNPGSGAPKMSQMKAQMQSLKQQLQQMIEQMKQGQSGNGQKKNGKEIGKSIAQYEKFKDAMKQLMDNNGSLTPEATQKLNQINQLIQENINDLIDKNISPELIKRQDRIITRLLEAENSDFQRKTDNERKSREGKELPKNDVSQFFNKFENKYRYHDLLDKSTIQLTPFYEKKYKEYLLKRENN